MIALEYTHPALTPTWGAGPSEPPVFGGGHLSSNASFGIWPGFCGAPPPRAGIPGQVGPFCGVTFDI